MAIILDKIVGKMYYKSKAGNNCKEVEHGGYCQDHIKGSNYIAKRG